MASKPVVYLAEVTDDLEEDRDVLRTELERRGVRVVPESRLPITCEEFIATVRGAMQEAASSIHLVGRYYGRRPEGDERSVTHIQYDIATEVRKQREQSGQPLELLTWIPEDLEPSKIGGNQGRFLQSLLNDYDTAAKPVEVFYSYAHEDEQYVNELRASLIPLERRGLISCWHDRDIVPGQEWDEDILKSLESARLILFLVSRHFMASEYIFKKELARAMELHEAGEARVVPIIVRPADWQDSPFGKLQALPRDGLPISKWDDHDDAYVAISKGIQQLAESLQAGDTEAALADNGGDVLTSSFEKFKEAVLSRFPSQGPAPDFSPAVYIAGGPDEFLQSETARQLCDYLRRHEFGVVEACSEGSSEDQLQHEQANIRFSDAFLIYAGEGPVSWVQPKALLANQLSRRREKPVVTAVYKKCEQDLGISLPGIEILDGCECSPQDALESFLDRVKSQYVG